MFLRQDEQRDPVRDHTYQTLEEIMAAFCPPVKSVTDSATVSQFSVGMPMSENASQGWATQRRQAAAT